MDTFEYSGFPYTCPNCSGRIFVSAVDYPSACPECEADLTDDPKLKEHISIVHYLTDVVE